MSCLRRWNCISVSSIIHKIGVHATLMVFAKKHKYRKMKMHFDNTVEKDSAPKHYTEKLVFEMVKNIEVAFGKGTVKGQKREKTPTLTDIPFKKQSIFSNTFLTGRTFKLVTALI
jgi:hypothetical protein